MADCTYPVEIREEEWPEDSALLKWANLVIEALGKIGRRSDAAALYKDQMIAAGFVNVVETKYIWSLVFSICLLFGILLKQLGS